MHSFPSDQVNAHQATAKRLTTRRPDLTWRLEIVTVEGEEGERLHQLQRNRGHPRPHVGRRQKQLQSTGS